MAFFFLKDSNCEPAILDLQRQKGKLVSDLLFLKDIVLVHLVP